MAETCYIAENCEGPVNGGWKIRKDIADMVLPLNKSIVLILLDENGAGLPHGTAFSEAAAVKCAEVDRQAIVEWDDPVAFAVPDEQTCATCVDQWE